MKERLTSRNMESLPAAFRDHIQKQLQIEYEPFLESLHHLSPTSIRKNPQKNFNIQQATRPVKWSIYGLYLNERPIFTADPAFHGGAYYVQEASSMFLEQAITKTTDLSQSLRVLDLCAAPGGKSTHLLSLINKESILVSNEVIRSRASILSENIQKWGVPNCIVTNNDPEDFAALPGFFDVIVVDAPCSGEGLFRKDPASVKQWTEENVQLCQARQRRILHDIWPALRENGILIYATCTYNERENEENLQYFSNEHDIEFIELNPDPQWNIQTVKKEKVIGYRFFPHRNEGEGFFIAAMRKTEAVTGKPQKTKKRIIKAPAKNADKVKAWIKNADTFEIIQHDDLAFALPKHCVEDFETVLQFSKVIYAGTNLATFKHDKPVPEHALAVSSIVERSAFNVLPVEPDSALAYLKKEPINTRDHPKGYTFVSFENLGIGWINVLDNRSNNMYPQEWRIRMAQF